MADQTLAWGVPGTPTVKWHDNGDGTYSQVVYGMNGIGSGSPAPPSNLTVTSGVGVAIGVDALIVFVAGSGSGVSSIDISMNGGANWTNLFTNTPGPMPTGINFTVGPVRATARLRVTFSTTQPTITLVPV